MQHLRNQQSRLILPTLPVKIALTHVLDVLTQDIVLHVHQILLFLGIIHVKTNAYQANLVYLTLKIWDMCVSYVFMVVISV